MAEKLGNEEDRISDLPDEIIQHILSFLPSTKQAIRTCVLSKQWRNQWTRVPVLIFNFDGKLRKKFLKFIDNALLLHDCSKIHKFHLQYDSFDAKDARFTEKIHFATSKYVKDLYLSSYIDELLPEFLFNYASLVKLTTHYCSFMPNEMVNWGCLSSLEIACCNFPYQAMEHILYGSPSLKLLKLLGNNVEKIVIASKSLKKLLIRDERKISVLEISCPNLEELSLADMITEDPQLFPQAIENVLSVSSLLQSFKLYRCYELDRLVIASKSLKEFVLYQARSRSFDIEISCPQLEELKLSGYLNVNTAKLLNLLFLLYATIDFENHLEHKACKSLIIEVLQQLQHLKELNVGTWILEIVSYIKFGGRFSPMLNIQCLTVDCPYLVKHHSGIAHLLRISPVLEKLVINVPRYCKDDHTNIGKSDWDSNAVVFDCLVSHLKTIKIMGFPQESGRHEHILNLVKFLLKNAKILEKMVVILGDHNRTSQSDLSRILLSLSRCSQNAIIEVLRSNSNK